MLETNEVKTAPAIKNAIEETCQKLRENGHRVVKF